MNRIKKTSTIITANDIHWSKVDVEKASQQFDHIWQFVPKDIDSLLDVGGGFGAVYESLQRSGRNKIRYMVLDQSHQAIKKAIDRGIKGIQHNLDENPIPLADGSVDMVFASDVLEHLRNPWAVLAECNRVSRKYVFVHGPNFAYWRDRLDALRGRPIRQMVVNKYGALVSDDDRRASHIYYITFNNLMYWGSKCGLTPIAVRVFWYRRYRPFRWFLEPFFRNFGSQYQIIFQKTGIPQIHDPNLQFHYD